MPDLMTNLVYFHSFEEVVSNNFFDRMGAMNLVCSAPPPLVAPGKVGNGADFTAAQQQYCWQNSNPVNQVGDIDCSWAVWVKPQGETLDYLAIFAKGTNEYVLRWYSNEIQWLIFPPTGNASFVKTQLPYQALRSQWSFVVCYHDAMRDKIGLSLNGGPPFEADYAEGITAGNGQFSVGRYGGVHYFGGQIDELGCWKNRVLTDADIQELWNGGNGLAWPFQREPASGNLLTRRTQNVPNVPYVGKGW